MSKNLSCQEVRAVVAEAAGSSLKDPESGPLREHLDGCPECRRFSEEHRHLMETLLGDSRPDPGPEFWNRMTGRIMAEVRQRELAPEPWYKKIRFNPLAWPVYAWSPVAALLLFAVLWFYYLPAHKAVPISGNGLSSEALVLDEGLDSLVDRVATLTPRESTRLKQKVVAGLAKDLKTDSSVEAVLDWDLNNHFEALTNEELEKVAKRLQTIGPTGATEVLHNVS